MLQRASCRLCALLLLLRVEMMAVFMTSACTWNTPSRPLIRVLDNNTFRLSYYHSTAFHADQLLDAHSLIDAGLHDLNIVSGIYTALWI